MNITDTLIYKTTSIEVAVTCAIKELYVPSCADNFLEILEISGNVGTVVEECSYATVTNYYITTVISPELTRVEVCTSTERVYMNKYIYLYAFNVNDVQEFHKLSQESHDELVKSPDINKRYLRRLIHTGKVEVKYGKQD